MQRRNLTRATKQAQAHMHIHMRAPCPRPTLLATLARTEGMLGDSVPHKRAAQSTAMQLERATQQAPDTHTHTASRTHANGRRTR